jgi:hypothetical protein
LLPGCCCVAFLAFFTHRPVHNSLFCPASLCLHTQNRLAAGGSLLPQRYRRLLIKAQSSLRYEEFDFSYYNKTRFAGLENDLPNCYCNALLQVRV